MNPTNESIGRAFREIDAEYPKAKPPCNVFTRLVMDRARELDRQAPGEWSLDVIVSMLESYAATPKPHRKHNTVAIGQIIDSLALAPQPPAQEQGDGEPVAWRHKGPDGKWLITTNPMHAMTQAGYGLETQALYTRAAVAEDARDADMWKLCTGTHPLENGEVAKMHVIVGVNVWRGEEWLAFHQCTPEEAREVIAAIASQAQEGEGNG